MMCAQLDDMTAPENRDAPAEVWCCECDQPSMATFEARRQSRVPRPPLRSAQVRPMSGSVYRCANCGTHNPVSRTHCRYCRRELR